VVNTTAVLALEVGALMLGVAVYVLHGYQVDRMARNLLNQASREQQDAHPLRAAAVLGRYIELRPGDLDAKARFGLLLAGVARTPEERARSLLVLDRVLLVHGSRRDVRREAVRLAMSLEHFDAALGHVQILLEEQPEDAPLLRLAAECERGLGHWKQAGAWYERALRAAPGDAGAVGEYATLLRERLADPARADAVVEGLLAAAPRAPEARLAAARYFARYGPQERAAREVRFALDDLKAHDCDLLLLAADLAEAGGRREEADRLLREARQYHPGDPRLARRLAHTEPVLRRLIDPAARAPAAVVAWARRELALRLAARGDYRRFQEAVALLDQNDKEAPASAEEQRARALVLATQPGRRRDALRLFERLALDPAPLAADVRLTMVTLYEADGQWPPAREQLLALVREDGDNPAYLGRLVHGLLAHDEASRTDVWVRKLVRLAPTAFETVEIQARALQARGKAEEAVRVLQNYAGRKGVRPDRVAAVLDELGHPAEAGRMYRDYRAAAPAERRRALPLALHLARHGRVKEALDLCDEARDDRNVEPAAAVAVAALGSGRADVADRKRVEGWLTAATDEHPRSVPLLLFLAALHEQAGRHAAARAAYERILRLDPHHLLALNNLAYSLALSAGRQEEARRYINAAIAHAGPAAELLDTRALIELRGRHAEPAVRDLERALEQGPTAARYFHLAEAEHLRGADRAAARALRKAAALGLAAARLPPLEQPAYVRLTKELSAKTGARHD
jgi:tetratricopeptide (TPR) repeat protein